MIENALGALHSDFLLSPPLREPKCIFLGSSLWEPGGMLGRKTHEHMVNPLDCELLGFSHSHANPHSTINSSSKLPFKCSYQLPQQFLLQVRRSWMCLNEPVYADCGVEALQTQVFDGFKKSHWFSVCQAFSFHKDKRDNFSTFYQLKPKGRLLLLFLLPLLSQLLE